MKFFTILIILIFPLFSNSQNNDTAKHYVVDQVKELALLTGFNIGNYPFFEIGLATNIYGRVGRHPNGSSCFVASEVKMGNKLLVGPKVGIHVTGGLAFGVNFIYYTDFSNGSFVIRPDIGAGLDKFKIVYGYNVKLTNKSFDLINSNVLSIAYLIRLKKIKSIKR